MVNSPGWYRWSKVTLATWMWTLTRDAPFPNIWNLSRGKRQVSGQRGLVDLMLRLQRNIFGASTTNMSPKQQQQQQQQKQASYYRNNSGKKAYPEIVLGYTTKIKQKTAAPRINFVSPNILGSITQTLHTQYGFRSLQHRKVKFYSRNKEQDN